MAKKVVVDINTDGFVKAETFNYQGSGCLQELEKLLACLEGQTETDKKDDYYREKGLIDNNIHVKSK